MWRQRKTSWMVWKNGFIMKMTYSLLMMILRSYGLALAKIISSCKTQCAISAGRQWRHSAWTYRGGSGDVASAGDNAGTAGESGRESDPIFPILWLINTIEGKPVSKHLHSYLVALTWTGNRGRRNDELWSLRAWVWHSGEHRQSDEGLGGSAVSGRACFPGYYGIRGLTFAEQNKPPIRPHIRIVLRWNG